MIYRLNQTSEYMLHFLVFFLLYVFFRHTIVLISILCILYVMQIKKTELNYENP